MHVPYSNLSVSLPAGKYLIIATAEIEALQAYDNAISLYLSTSTNYQNSAIARYAYWNKWIGFDSYQKQLIALIDLSATKTIYQAIETNYCPSGVKAGGQIYYLKIR